MAEIKKHRVEILKVENVETFNNEFVTKVTVHNSGDYIESNLKMMASDMPTKTMTDNKGQTYKISDWSSELLYFDLALGESKEIDTPKIIAPEFYASDYRNPDNCTLSIRGEGITSDLRFRVNIKPLFIRLKETAPEHKIKNRSISIRKGRYMTISKRYADKLKDDKRFDIKEQRPSMEEMLKFVDEERIEVDKKLGFRDENGKKLANVPRIKRVTPPSRKIDKNGPYGWLPNFEPDHVKEKMGR